jgi:hypothetical protein
MKDCAVAAGVVDDDARAPAPIDGDVVMEHVDSPQPKKRRVAKRRGSLRDLVDSMQR